MIKTLRILKSHGIQYIKHLRDVQLPEIFRGRPEIATGAPAEVVRQLVELCPTGAIGSAPLSIDLGRCAFCGECEIVGRGYIRFTNDYRMAATSRQALVVREGDNSPIRLNRDELRPELRKIFERALKLRQVSAGGDNSTEMELNASGNVNFDFTRYGVDFVASPRHSDGVVITGPITQAMSVPLEICYAAVPSPKIIILAGCDAISGGLFADSKAINRTFLEHHTPDLYLAGNPVHPLTFINGCIDAFIEK